MKLRIYRNCPQPTNDNPSLAHSTGVGDRKNPNAKCSFIADLSEWSVVVRHGIRLSALDHHPNESDIPETIQHL